VHKYSSLRSTTHRAAAGAAPRIVLQQAAAAAVVQLNGCSCTFSEGSMSSLKSIT